MVTQKIVYEEISKVFVYNEITGDLFRFMSINGRTEKHTGYISVINGRARTRIAFKSKLFYAHRVAWVLGNKTSIPDGMVIDHINGNCCDNRLQNLRAVTYSVNNQNIRKATKASKSGLLGAFWNKREKKWSASIMVDRKKYYLGFFLTKEAAHESYMEAKRRLHPGCMI